MALKFITVLLVCQLAGEIAARALAIPVPGPVLGMALLFAGLIVTGGVPQGLATTAQGLLDNLALLFVPAGVGVIVHLPLLADEYPALGVSLIGSTVLTIIVTAVVMQAVSRRTAGEHRK